MKNGSIGSIVSEVSTGALYRIEGVADGTVTLKEAVLLNDVYVLAPVPKEKKIPENVLEYFFSTVAYGQPETPDVQSFSVRGGSLYYKGEQVETGTYVPVDIVTAIPGAVVLRIKSKDGNGVDLVTYDPDADEFKKLAFASDAAKVMSVYTDPQKGFGVYIRKDVKTFLVEEEDPQNGAVSKKQEETTRDTLLIYVGKRVVAERSLFEGARTNVTTFSVPGGKNIVFSTDDGVKNVTDAEGVTRVVRDTEKDGQRSRVVCVRLREITTGTPTGPVYDLDVACDTVDFNGQIEDILPAVDNENFVFVTSSPAGIVHSNWPHFKRVALGQKVVDAIQEYPIPLSIFVPHDNETSFVFGNGDYGACRINVTKTDDRGYVTKIEKI